MENWYTAELHVIKNMEFYPYEKAYAAIKASSYGEVEEFIKEHFEKTGLTLRNILSIKKSYHAVSLNPEFEERYNVEIIYTLSTGEEIELLYLIDAEDEEYAEEEALILFHAEYRGDFDLKMGIVEDMPVPIFVAEKTSPLKDSTMNITNIGEA